MDINLFLAAAYMMSCSAVLGSWSAAAIIRAMRTGSMTGWGLNYARSSNRWMFWGGVTFHLSMITVGAVVICLAVLQLMK